MVVNLLRTAIEEVSAEVEPDQAVRKDMLITSEMLRLVHGQKDTPEVATKGCDIYTYV